MVVMMETIRLMRYCQTLRFLLEQTVNMALYIYHALLSIRLLNARLSLFSSIHFFLSLNQTRIIGEYGLGRSNARDGFSN
jgi:hypothetical protein